MSEFDRRLSEAFVKLADTLVGDFDVAEVLYHLVERCTELFDVDEAGLLLAEPGGGLHVMASTSETTHLIELLQVQNDEGPCRDAFRTGKEVVVPSLEAASERWPIFVTTATNAGFNSMVALPMRLRDQVIGAMNLFRIQTGTMSADEIAAAQALADVATISLLQDQAARDSRILVDQLHGALNSRIAIEQAKGIIFQVHSIDMGEAFRLLRAYSRDHNERIADVARQIIDGSLDLHRLIRA